MPPAAFVGAGGIQPMELVSFDGLVECDCILVLGGEVLRERMLFVLCGNNFSKFAPAAVRVHAVPRTKVIVFSTE